MTLLPKLLYGLGIPANNPRTRCPRGFPSLLVRVKSRNSLLRWRLAIDCAQLFRPKLKLTIEGNDSVRCCMRDRNSCRLKPTHSSPAQRLSVHNRHARLAPLILAKCSRRYRRSSQCRRTPIQVRFSLDQTHLSRVDHFSSKRGSATDMVHKMQPVLHQNANRDHPFTPPAPIHATIPTECALPTPYAELPIPDKHVFSGQKIFPIRKPES